MLLLRAQFSKVDDPAQLLHLNSAWPPSFAAFAMGRAEVANLQMYVHIDRRSNMLHGANGNFASAAD